MHVHKINEKVIENVKASNGRHVLSISLFSSAATPATAKFPESTRMQYFRLGHELFSTSLPSFADALFRPSLMTSLSSVVSVTLAELLLNLDISYT
jgi:hypothetical protein